MKPHSPALFALLAALPLATFAASETPNPAALTRAVSDAFVRVEYHLQFDKADAPAGGLAAERCPNCGQFHGGNLRKFLEEERPLETAGYLIAPRQVAILDPQIHPRFIHSITVRFRDQKASARIVSHVRHCKGAVLELSSRLAGAKPLQFKSAAAPAHVVTFSQESGHWIQAVHPFPSQTVIPDRGDPYHVTSLKGVAVAADGSAAGLILSYRLPLDGSWKGSPLKWPRQSADELTAQLEQLQNATRAALLRVHLGFRSPKTSSDPRDRFRYRPAVELGDDTTEAHVLGLLLPDNRVVVLADLKPRLTARLERIAVYSDGAEPVPAKFSASLKEFGAFVAMLEQPLDGTAFQSSAADVLDLREQLLLRADITLQGEIRTDYFQSARIATCDVGPQQRLYPALDEPETPNAFLFTLEGELVALPIKHREKISGQRQGNQTEKPTLTPARYLFDALAALPASADPGNAPVTEAEENRLAWMGVELQPLNRELARANGVSEHTRDGQTGALVSFVHPASPAAAAGISPGAILLRLKVPGQPLPVEVQMEDDSMRARAFPWERLDELTEQYFDRLPTPWPPVENAFIRALTDLGFGRRFTAEFFVNGKVQAHAFEIVPGPPHYDSAPRLKSDSLGLTVRDLTYDVRRFLQRPPDEPGVVVSKVETGSRASVAGVKPYELITHVNDAPVHNVQEFETLTAAPELKLAIKRMERGRIVSIKSAAAASP